MNTFKTALVLAPHTDDGEIGAGGLVNKLIEQGTEVFYVAFSICEESVPEGYPQDILSKEVISATSKLGIKSENVIVNRFKVRRFQEFRQEILDSMIEIRRKVKPDLVLMPSKYDCHQDHAAIYNEGVRAFKLSTMLGYEMPWNNIEFETNLVVELSKENINAKMKAFDSYESQSIRPYNSDDLLNLAKMRGLQIKTDYAEAFNIIRWLWK